MKKSFAFTLAEVLITLTIVGIIAALTIPNLISKYQEHAWHQQWKDDYAILNNAYKMVIAEEPDMVISAQKSYGMTQEFIDTFLSKLKVVETCIGNNHDCTNKKWSGVYAVNYSKYKNLAGYGVNSYNFGQRAALLKNGASIYLGGGGGGLSIMVDVNNYTTGPNIIGKDVYGVQFLHTNKAACCYYWTAQYVNELAIAPFGVNKSRNSGEMGCSPQIGLQNGTNNIMDAPGIGCSYKYLYEQ